MVLNLIFFILTFYVIILFFIPQTEINILRKTSVWVSAFILFLATYILITFELNSFYFQNLTTFSLGSSLMNVIFTFGLDGVSVLFFFDLTSYF